MDAATAVRPLNLLPPPVLRRRLDAQRISNSRFSKPEEVVALLGAVQAQDYLGALWAIGLRTTEARESDVEEAIAQRRILRTWPMRGTLHFVAAADARWMTELLMPRAAASAAGRMRVAGIDAALLAKARGVLERELEGGRRLTRPAVYRALEAAKVPTAGSRGLLILWQLAHDGALCFGPREGKQPTFVLFEEWLPKAKRLRREEALAELARRYFTGHGPATLADFAWWSGLTLADVRRGVAAAGTAIAGEVLDCPPPAEVAKGVTHVLPPFDEFLVGYADRTAATHNPSIIFQPTVVVGGRVVATWTRRLGRGDVAFTVAPFEPLTKPATHAIELALSGYAKFLGRGAGALQVVPSD